MRFIKKPKDFLKILIGYTIIAIFALFPILISVIGQYIGNLMGYEPNEANSMIVAMGWFAILTIPIGVLAGIIWTGICIYNIVLFLKNK
ncbi:MAG: hypothetical protein KatS3mg034_0532 [Vicingaceae bacterium]|nr:MAG: hypothetical protein KatS3mg034_0532 [Vicingaceae bacterium]